MRWSKLYLGFLCFLIGNSVLLFYFLHHQEQGTIKGGLGKQLHHDITIVLYEFEPFENKVAETAEAFASLLPHAQLLIVADEPVYPPLELPSRKNVKEIALRLYPEDPSSAIRIERYIKTDLVLFLPDSTKLLNVLKLKHWIDVFAEKQTADVVVFDVAQADREFNCFGLHFYQREWTLKYTHEERGSRCGIFSDPVAVLTRANLFQSFAVPFIRPFFEAFFIQSAVNKWRMKLVIKGSPFVSGHQLFTDPHNRWKHDRNVEERRRVMYERFGIKKVIHADKSEKWYGCNKDTSRCFGTVYNDAPSYIYRGRWTPPCCLKALRETAQHVFRIFEVSGVPYWLEGGSLLGAARIGDIIPWDYDIDIGMYQQDIRKIVFLRRASNGERVIDDKGFVWEHAKEGDFFRIQYSQMNHLHVDVFPFFEKNGIMTKNSWMKTHRQDTEFASHYLKPLEKIDFIGIKASCPNNVRKFLEFKFGNGVIENPQYPNPEKIKRKMGKRFEPPL